VACSAYNVCERCGVGCVPIVSTPYFFENVLICSDCWIDVEDNKEYFNEISIAYWQEITRWQKRNK